MGLFSSITKGIGNLASSAWSGAKSLASGALGSVVGGAVDLGGKYLQNELIGESNAKQSYERSEEASAKAFQRSYDAYKERYQTTMKDMHKAGLNPILASSGGFNVGNTPTSEMAKAPMPGEPTGSWSSARQAQSQSNLNQETQKKTTQEVIKTANEAEKVLHEITKIKGEIGQIGQKTLNLFNEHKKITADILATSTTTSINKVKLAAWRRAQKELIQSEDFFQSKIPRGFLNKFGDYIKASAKALKTKIGQNAEKYRFGD